MAQREKITWSKVLQDFYGMFCGKDYKLSIRRFLGTVAIIGIIRAFEQGYKGNVLPEYYLIGLIALALGFFGMTTYSTIKLNKTDDGG